MNDATSKFTRRRLIRTATMFGGAGLVAPALVGSNAAEAAEKLDASAASARTFGYVEVAADADVERFGDKARQARNGLQNCANCQFYADSGQDWAGCPLFGGREVAGAGWCKAWIAA